VTIVRPAYRVAEPPATTCRRNADVRIQIRRDIMTASTLFAAPGKHGCERPYGHDGKHLASR
jgi:hypothetical protein